MGKKDMDKKLLRFLEEDQVSEDEIKEWIASDKDNIIHFELIKKINEEKKFLNQLKKVNLDKNWEKFQNSVDGNFRRLSAYSISLRKTMYLSGIAAAILLFILTLTTIHFAKYKDANHIQQVSSFRSNTEIKLSDGSTIVLNKGSVLSYPGHLSRRRREVKLSGEAYFEIVKKDASPFYVQLKNTTVQVLGTSFNIKEENNGTTIINVLTGKVTFFETGRNNNSVQLEAGQKGIFNSINGKFEQGNCQSENFLFWKTRKLSFEDQHLAIVFNDLEKSFNTRIVVEDKDILQNRFTSDCEGQELDDILNELSILFHIGYYKKGDTIYIQSGPK
jgi:transmembrane sensor